MLDLVEVKITFEICIATKLQFKNELVRIFRQLKGLIESILNITYDKIEAETYLSRGTICHDTLYVSCVFNCFLC